MGGISCSPPFAHSAPRAVLYVTVAIEISKATDGFSCVTPQVHNVTHNRWLYIYIPVRQIPYFLTSIFLLAYIKITMKRPIFNVLCKGVDDALKLAKVH